MAWYYISIGDWSDDGHGNCEYYRFKSNIEDVAVLRNAYMESVKLTGVGFAHSHRNVGNYIEICTRYEDSNISEKAYELLKNHMDLTPYIEIEEDDRYGVDYIWKDNMEKTFSILILEFIKLSCPEFEYGKLIPGKQNDDETAQPLNGWWCEGLNVQFGYGLFYS